MLHPLFSDILAATFPTLCGEARASVALDGETHCVEEARCGACDAIYVESSIRPNRCLFCGAPYGTAAAPRDERKGE